MRTITFKGISERIEINGKYTSIKVSSFSDKIVTPLIHFVFMDGEEETEPIDLNFSYEVLYTTSIYFETVQDHECELTFQLLN